MYGTSAKIAPYRSVPRSFPDAHVGDDALLHFALLTAWWWAQAALLAVAIGVTWHILSFATLKKGVPVQEDPEGE